MWLYRAACFLLRVLFMPFFAMKVEGAGLVPADGPVIITANHRSLWDPLLIAMVTKRQIHYMAKAELFKFKPFGQVLRFVGAFPVDRASGDVKAIKTALKILKDGECLGVFPEGKRVREDEMGALKDGVAMLAYRGSARVVPVYMDGKRRFRGHVTAYVGQPLDLPPVAGNRATSEEVGHVTSMIRDALDALAPARSS